MTTDDDWADPETREHLAHYEANPGALTLHLLADHHRDQRWYPLDDREAERVHAQLHAWPPTFPDHYPER